MRISLISCGAFAAAILALQGAFSSPSLACGSIRDWIQVYQDASSDERRTFAIMDIAAACNDYDTRRDDAELTAILADALARDLPRDRIQHLFDTYRCLPSQRATPAYTSLATLDSSKCPSDADVAAWGVVKADRVRLRSEASPDGAVIGHLMRGNVVARRGAGEWVSVETWQGAEGFVHRSMIEAF
jgi:hypothetical protein